MQISFEAVSRQMILWRPLRVDVQPEKERWRRLPRSLGEAALRKLLMVANIVDCLLTANKRSNSRLAIKPDAPS